MECYALLILSYKFRLQCFKTETAINDYRKNRNLHYFSEIHLAEIAKLNHNIEGEKIKTPETVQKEEETINIIKTAVNFLKVDKNKIVINESDPAKHSVKPRENGDNIIESDSNSANSEKDRQEKTLENKNEELDAGNYIQLFKNIPKRLLMKHYLEQSELSSSVNANVPNKDNETYRLEPGEVLPLEAKLTPVKYKIDRNLSETKTLKDTSDPKSDEPELSRPSEDVNRNTKVPRLIPVHNNQLDCSSTAPSNSRIGNKRKRKPRKRQSKAKIKAIEGDPNISRKGRKVSKKSTNKRKTKSPSQKKDIVVVANNNSALSEPPAVNQETLYETLDIKQEPLYAEDYLNSFEYIEQEPQNHDMEWNNDPLASASQSLDDIHNIDNIIDILPEIGDEMDIPEYIRINRINPVSFKDIDNIWSWKPPDIDKPSVKKDKNRSVSLTGGSTYPVFSSHGDYINDHDYLASPYVTNDILRQKGNKTVCVCWLCNVSHGIKQHSFHMRSHQSTTCSVCHVNFHNIFLLNIHVKCHYSFCTACKTTVSYLIHHLHVKCASTTDESMYETDQHYKDIDDKNVDNQKVLLNKTVTSTKPAKAQPQQQLKPDKDSPLNIRRSNRIAKRGINKKIQKIRYIFKKAE